MIGESFQIEVRYGVGTRKVWATVIERRQNNEFELECDNGNRYLRRLVWEPLKEQIDAKCHGSSELPSV